MRGYVITIELAAEEDICRIMEIERETISPPWTHGALLSEIYREDSFFAVAIYGAQSVASCSQIQGFVILRRVADEGELFQIAVDKAARRCGVAGRLIEAALRYAQENALRTIYLEVRKSNEAAISLYKKHGFESVRSRKDYFSRPVEDAVVMRKVLLC